MDEPSEADAPRPDLKAIAGLTDAQRAVLDCIFDRFESLERRVVEAENRADKAVRMVEEAGRRLAVFQ